MCLTIGIFTYRHPETANPSLPLNGTRISI